MREVENLPFGPTARWTSLNLVGSFDRPPGCRTWLGAPVEHTQAWLFIQILSAAHTRLSL